MAAWVSGLSGKAWLKNYKAGDEVEVTECIYDPERVDVVIVNDTFLLAYMVAEPWYLHKNVLIEELVLRIYRNRVSFDKVTEALDFIAKENNACGICTGTVLSKDDNSVSRKYLNAGYLPDGTRLYKSLI